MNENYEKEYNLDNISKDIEIKNYMSNKENFKSSSYQIENIKQEDETKTSAKKRFYFSELGGNNNKNDLLQIKEKIRLQDKDNSIGVLKSPDSYSNLVNSKAIKEIKPETSNILKSNVQNYNKNKEIPVEELFKLHCSHNKKDKNTSNNQIDDLMSSIAQYNSIASLKNNYTSNNIEQNNSQINSQTTNLLNRNLPGNISKQSNALNNSNISGNSIKLSSISNKKPSKVNVIYVDLRKDDRNRNKTKNKLYLNHNPLDKNRNDSSKTKKSNNVIIRSSLKEGLIKIITNRKSSSKSNFKEGNTSTRSYKSTNNSLSKSQIKGNFSLRKVPLKNNDNKNITPEVKIKSIGNKIEMFQKVLKKDKNTKIK